MDFIRNAGRVARALLIAFSAAMIVGLLQFGFIFMPPTIGLVYESCLAVAAVLWWRRRAIGCFAGVRSWREPAQLVGWAAALVSAIGGAQHFWVVAGPLPTEILNAIRHTAGSMSLGIAACIVAPLLEEALFRGWLLRRLRAEVGDGTALLLSAACFTLAHLDATRALSQVAMGILLASIVIRTGQLWLAALTHSVINLSGLVEEGLAALHVPDFLGPIWPVVCGAVAIVAAVRFRTVLRMTSWKVVHPDHGCRHAAGWTAARAARS